MVPIFSFNLIVLVTYMAPVQSQCFTSTMIAIQNMQMNRNLHVALYVLYAQPSILNFNIGMELSKTRTVMNGIQNSWLVH